MHNGDPLQFPIDRAREVARDADEELANLSTTLWKSSIGDAGKHGANRIESVKTRL